LSRMAGQRKSSSRPLEPLFPAADSTCSSRSPRPGCPIHTFVHRLCRVREFQIEPACPLSQVGRCPDANNRDACGSTVVHRFWPFLGVSVSNWVPGRAGSTLLPSGPLREPRELTVRGEHAYRWEVETGSTGAACPRPAPRGAVARAGGASCASWHPGDVRVVRPGGRKSCTTQPSAWRSSREQ